MLIYGVDAALWSKLPPDDQAAVKATYLGQPIPQIGGYATNAAQPVAATSAPPPTLTATAPDALGRLPSAGFVEIPKTSVRATMLPSVKNAEIIRNTLAAHEARIGTIATDLDSWWPETDDAPIPHVVRVPTRPGCGRALSGTTADQRIPTSFLGGSESGQRRLVDDERSHFRC